MARSPTSRGRDRGTSTSRSRTTRRQSAPSCGKTTRGDMAFDLTDGLAVRALGRLTVYPPRGEYQIVVREIEPEGIGALELAFRQRYAKLALEGLFDPGRKRPLPRFPRRIVVVTSPTGAAVRDILQVTSRRWRCTQILIAPARVQGVGADREVVAALELANQVAGADVIIVARGGGSLEDLWTFNEESVVRAIVASRLPVVSAVGHEIDVTLADLAADKRALTPSEAGEYCVPDAREVASPSRPARRPAARGRPRASFAMRAIAWSSSPSVPARRSSMTCWPAAIAWLGLPPASKR